MNKKKQADSPANCWVNNANKAVILLDSIFRLNPFFRFCAAICPVSSDLNDWTVARLHHAMQLFAIAVLQMELGKLQPCLLIKKFKSQSECARLFSSKEFLKNLV